MFGACGNPHRGGSAYRWLSRVICASRRPGQAGGHQGIGDMAIERILENTRVVFTYFIRYYNVYFDQL